MFQQQVQSIGMYLDDVRNQDYLTAELYFQESSPARSQLIA